MPDTDDADIWRRLRHGDTAAFGELFDRHGARIHRYAVRRTGDVHTADDVTAVVFLEVWRRRAEVELHQPSALPWLYGVAANAINHWSRSRRRHDLALARLAAQTVDGLGSSDAVSVERRAEALAESTEVLERVRALPRRYRDVLVMSVWEGLSHAEIAEALDISGGTVKSRLSRARAQLSRTNTSIIPTPSATPASSTIPTTHAASATPAALNLSEH